MIQAPRGTFDVLPEDAARRDVVETQAKRILGAAGYERIETPAYERFMTAAQARAVLDSVNGFHPLGRHGYPEDVVEAIVFYASERARWITGTTMPVDGGVLAGRNAPPETAAAEQKAA